MNNKGFEGLTENIKTLSDESFQTKPLKSENRKSTRVDINDLKSKLQETENKEFRKNMYILFFLILGLASLGIYLSV